METEKNTKHFSFGAGRGIIAGISDFAGRTVARANTIKITADPSSMNTKTCFRGLGCTVSSGSTKLLLDYKTLHAEAYTEILSLLFKKEYGAELSHIRLELGSDVNSVSGTEPSVMRSEDDENDIMRSSGFIFVSDALKINPDITVELMNCGEPFWVKNAFSAGKRNGYRARYNWYLETIKSAYRTLGIKFTHINPEKDEISDSEWLIYFAKRLKSEKNKLYDYGKIKIISSGCNKELTENEEFKKYVDIINFRTPADVIEDTGKEIWYCDGKSPGNVPRFAINCDASGIAGKNSITDIASQMILGFSGKKMTMYEFCPAIAGYYSGTSHFPAQLITANSPWSGHYSVNSGFFMAMHFTRFVGENWHFIDSGNESCIALMPENKSELTMIFCNDTQKPKGYAVNIASCNMEGRIFKIIETKAPCLNKHYASNWFRQTYQKKASRGKFYIEVKGGSVLTLTTLDTSFVKGIDTVKRPLLKQKRLELPYKDSFCYPSVFSGTRGSSPLLTTDLGGCFEISGNLLQQKVRADMLPENSIFRDTPYPITCLGDDSWVNYSAEIEFFLDTFSEDNYAGIGVHYYSSCACENTAECGCSVKVYADGHADIYFMDKIILSVRTDNLNKNRWNKIKILALANIYMIYLNDKFIGDFEEKNIICPCGRVALLSGFYENKFRNLKVNPVSGTVEYADRIDALSSLISYTRDAYGDCEASYKYSNRTNVTLGEYTSLELEYTGYGFALCGTVERAEIEIELDGNKISVDNIEVGGTQYMQAFYRMKNVAYNNHKIRINVLSGEIILDSVLVFGNLEILPEKKSSQTEKPSKKFSILEFFGFKE